jgi:hypothetical protein
MNSTTRGTPAVPFSELFRDTVLAHGVRWAAAYYSKHGMPTWEFLFWLNATRRGLRATTRANT